ncbi:hypothetical protein TcWFU_000342 [Taenia crassiceps]|uniref:Uncharacterized protein n=1 Tax=Taenia crassiceps TaxID=6207 RepID=A0ABR4Q6U6_9CEST
MPPHYASALQTRFQWSGRDGRDESGLQCLTSVPKHCTARWQHVLAPQVPPTLLRSNTTPSAFVYSFCKMRSSDHWHCACTTACLLPRSPQSYQTQVLHGVTNLHGPTLATSSCESTSLTRRHDFNNPTISASFPHSFDNSHLPTSNSPVLQHPVNYLFLHPPPSLSLSLPLSPSLSLPLSLCPSIYLFICLSVCLSVTHGSFPCRLLTPRAWCPASQCFH